METEEANDDGPPTGNLSRVLGFVAAVFDNNTGGVLPVRELAAKFVSDKTSFNQGQDDGDNASLAQGAAEVVTGEVIQDGALTATALSGGTTSEVTLPAAGAGYLTKVHGGITAANALYAKATNKGRLDTKENRRVENEHTSNKRESTRNDHEEAQGRKQREQKAADQKYSSTKSTKGTEKSNNQRKRENPNYKRKGPKGEQE